MTSIACGSSSAPAAADASSSGNPDGSAQDGPIASDSGSLPDGSGGGDSGQSNDTCTITNGVLSVSCC